MDPSIKSSLLRKYGYDPEQYDIDDSFNIIPVKAKAQPSVTPAPVIAPEQPSKGSAFGRNAMLGVAPALAGAGGWAVGAGLAPATGGTSLLIPLVASLGAAGVAGYAQNKMLEQSEGGREFLAETQRASEAHPLTALAGGLAPNLGLVRPSFSTLRDAGKAVAGARVADLPARIAENPAAMNVALGTALGAGQGIYQEMTDPGEFNAGRLLLNTGAGALLNQPWRHPLNRMLGFHPSGPVETTFEGGANAVVPTRPNTRFSVGSDGTVFDSQGNPIQTAEDVLSRTPGKPVNRRADDFVNAKAEMMTEQGIPSAVTRPEQTPESRITTETGNEIYNDYTGVTEQANAEAFAESARDLELRRLEAQYSGEERPRYQPRKQGSVEFTGERTDDTTQQRQYLDLEEKQIAQQRLAVKKQKVELQRKLLQKELAEIQAGEVPSGMLPPEPVPAQPALQEDIVANTQRLASKHDIRFEREIDGTQNRYDPATRTAYVGGDRVDAYPHEPVHGVEGDLPPKMQQRFERAIARDPVAQEWIASEKARGNTFSDGAITPEREFLVQRTGDLIKDRILKRDGNLFRDLAAWFKTNISRTAKPDDIARWLSNRYVYTKAGPGGQSVGPKVLTQPATQEDIVPPSEGASRFAQLRQEAGLPAMPSAEGMARQNAEVQGKDTDPQRNRYVQRQPEEQGSSVTPEQNNLLKGFYKAANSIAKRTSYGKTEGVVNEPSYIAVWSNAHNQWDIARGLGKKSVGDVVSLDTNQVLVPAKTLRDANIIAESLPELPLAKFAFERSPLNEKKQLPFDEFIEKYKNFIDQKPENIDVVKATEMFMDKLRSPEQYKQPESQGSTEGAGKPINIIYKGIQPGYKSAKVNIPDRHLWNINERDNADFPFGTTVTEETLREKGYHVPEKPPEGLRQPEDQASLYDYVDEQYMIENKDDLTLEDVLDHTSRLFKYYPYLRKLNVEYVNDRHPVVNGEPMRIQTLGGGEGTIFVNRSYWDDALNGKDAAARQQFRDALVHEAAHAVQDRENRLDDYGVDLDKTGKLEREANDFSSRYQPADQASITDTTRKGFFTALASDFDRVAKVSKTASDAFHEWAGLRDRYLGLRNVAIAEAQRFSEPDLTQAIRYMRDMYRNGTSELAEPRPEILRSLKDYFGSIRDEQIKEGMTIHGREAGKNEWYVPDMLSDKALDVLTKRVGSETYKKYVEDWTKYLEDEAGMNREEALATVNDYIGALGAKKDNYLAVNFGALRKAAGYGLPAEMRETNAIRVLDKYGRRAATDLAMFVAMEKPAEIRNELHLRDPETGEYPSSAQDRHVSQSEEVRKAMKWVLNSFEGAAHPRIASAIRVVNNALLGAPTGVRDIVSVPVNSIPYIQKFSDLGAFFKGMSNWRENAAASLRTNARNANLDTLQWGDVMAEPDRWTAVANKTATALRKYQGRELLEQASRIWTFGIGKELASAKLLAARSGDAKAKAWLEKFGRLTDLENPDLDQIAKNFVDRVQGTYDGRGLPGFTVEGSTAPFFALQKWGIEKSNVIWQDVVKPFMDGSNRMPLLTYVFGSFLTGAAIQELNKLLTGRKAQDATLKETMAELTPVNAVAELATLMQLGSFAGIVGDLSKMAADGVLRGRLSRNVVSFPTATFAADVSGKFADAGEAIKEGENSLRVVSALALDVMTGHIQTARAIANHTFKSDEVARSDKFRDLRTFKTLSGEPTSDIPTGANKYLNADVRKFKQTSSPEEAAALFPELMDKVIEKVGDGKPEKAIAFLRGLKGNSYQTVPSPENFPLEFVRYWDFLKRTQGEEAALARVRDYFQQNELNRAKSRMVPSL